MRSQGPDRKAGAALQSANNRPGNLAQAGGLISYGPDQLATFGRTAYFVDRVLKGASPAGIPIEQPTRYLLVVNLQTAKALGITIPQSIMLRAGEVIR